MCIQLKKITITTTKPSNNLSLMEYLTWLAWCLISCKCNIKNPAALPINCIFWHTWCINRELTLTISKRNNSTKCVWWQNLPVWLYQVSSDSFCCQMGAVEQDAHTTGSPYKVKSQTDSKPSRRSALIYEPLKSIKMSDNLLQPALHGLSDLLSSG